MKSRIVKLTDEIVVRLRISSFSFSKKYRLSDEASHSSNASNFPPKEEKVNRRISPEIDPEIDKVRAKEIEIYRIFRLEVKFPLSRGEEKAYNFLVNFRN